MTPGDAMPTVERWRKALVAADGSIQDAISCLDRSAVQIALVVSPDGTLLGTITDGDIRRGLLRGLALSSPLSSVVRHEPLVVPAEMDRATVLQLMRANVYSAIPVVDASHHVVGLHLLNELIAPQRRSNAMVIMAGGRGARLHPLTENCPKPLLPVGGKPMLEHIIERAKGEGITRFVIAVHYLGHMIEAYFGNGERLGVDVSYLREESPLGTAGALTLLHPAPTAPILVTNGDVLADIRYGELLDFHTDHAAVATMAVRLHEWQHPFGVVQTRGVDIVGFEEKPVMRSHINAGIYVLDPAALKALAVNEHCDMPSLFARLQAQGDRTIVYPMHEPWLDAGHAEDLERAEARHRSKSDPKS
jgi:dTDP-glucose pyrophosphorylase/CBS domain-containing protein